MQLFNFANLFLTVGLAAVSVTATPIDDGESGAYVFPSTALKNCHYPQPPSPN